MQYYNLYDTALSFILPLTTIIILNFITAYTLWELADVRRAMTIHRKYIFVLIFNCFFFRIENEESEIEKYTYVYIWRFHGFKMIVSLSRQIRKFFFSLSMTLFDKYLS